MIAWRLARTRLRRHPLRLLSQSLSIALGLLTLLAVQTISSSSQANLAQSSLNQLSPGDRNITVSSNRVITSPSTLNEIEKFLRTQLHGSIEAGTTQELLYHQLSDEHGNSAYFGGVDFLSQKTSLISGRQPGICRAAKCEVLQIGGTDKESQVAGRLGLTIVGSAKIIDPQMFSGTYQPDKGVVLFVANGVLGASSLSSLTNLQGSNGWVSSIDIRALRDKGTKDLLKNLLGLENEISTRFSGLSLTWPSDAVSQSESQWQELNQKLGILYYVLIFIFLAFQIILARIRVREVADFHKGLTSLGAPKKLIFQVHLLETLAPTGLGLLFCTFIAAIIKVVWWNAGADFRIQPTGLAVASLGATALLVLIMTFSTQFMGQGEWNKVLRKVGGLIILLLAFVFKTSGEMFATELSPSFWLTVLAYTFCVCMSVFLFGRIANIWRKNRHTTFVLAQEGMRTWQGVCAVIGIAVALVSTSLGYQNVVQKEIRTAVDSQVPLDFVFRVGPALIKPLDVETLDGYSKKIEGSSAWAVLRLGGAVRNQGSIVDQIAVVGIAPNILNAFSSTSYHHLQNILAPSPHRKVEEIPLESARSISITLNGIPKAIDLVGWFRTTQNAHLSVMSTDHGDVRKLLLPKSIPPGSSLIGLEFHETSEYLSRRLHALGEGKFSVPAIKGIGRVLAVSINGKLLTIAQSGWLTKEFSFEFDGGSVYLWPHRLNEMPTVITDPITAALAEGSTLTLSAVTQDNFKVRIGAVKNSFPSAGKRFVIMDIDTLQNIVGRNAPGAVDPTEVWVSTQQPFRYSTEMESSPYSSLEIISRQDVEAKERSEPSRRAISAAFLLGIGYALMLSVLVLLLAPLLWLRERFALIRYMETQGISKFEIKSGVRRIFLILLLAGAISGLTFSILLAKFAGGK